jgi:uridine monophosphate synthetase
MDFYEKLDHSIERRDSLLCVGIDPPQLPQDKEIGAALIGFGERIIGETHPFAACFKPNIAFFERYGPPGLAALEKIISLVPNDIPVILDAKRGDIGSTAVAYADSLFGYYGADAVTISPYLGIEAVRPFLEWAEKGLFVLCRTSNPGSQALQTLPVRRGEENEPLYLAVAEEAAAWGANVGLVVGANMPEALQKIRSRHPDIWFLSPGIGAQGGRANGAVRLCLRKDGSGVLFNVSRGISGSDSPAEAARRFRDDLNRARGGSSAMAGPAPAPLDTERHKKKRFIKRLIESGCFQIGRFRLKSGLMSPFYIDLRLIISDPELLTDAAGAMASLVRDIPFDRIAGIPLGGVPLATALSLHLGKPMIIPRQAKEHGTGRKIEGIYRKGETVLLVDELITKGTSMAEALEILRTEGLEVRDLAVLIERGGMIGDELSEKGCRLHSYLRVEEFLEVCREMGAAEDGVLSEIKAYLSQA